jgi:hypothetical protein
MLQIYNISDLKLSDSWFGWSWDFVFARPVPSACAKCAIALGLKKLKASKKNYMVGSISK